MALSSQHWNFVKNEIHIQIHNLLQFWNPFAISIQIQEFTWNLKVILNSVMNDL